VGKNKKMALGGLVFIFAMFLLGAVLPSSTDDGTKQIQKEEQKTEKVKVSVTEKDTSRLVSDEEMDRRLAGFEESEKALEKSSKIIISPTKEEQKQEAASIQKLYGLPASCDGVDSIETWLYPTAEKCMKELGQGYHAWCLSETKGDKAKKADLCVIDVASRLVQLCEDPVLSSPEVCLMYNMKYIYQEMQN